MYQKILVPIDGSATSARGLEEAIRLAQLTGGQLRLVHVTDELSAGFAMECYAGSGDWLTTVRENGANLFPGSDSDRQGGRRAGRLRIARRPRRHGRAAGDHASDGVGGGFDRARYPRTPWRRARVSRQQCRTGAAPFTGAGVARACTGSSGHGYEYRRIEPDNACEIAVRSAVDRVSQCQCGAYVLALVSDHAHVHANPEPDPHATVFLA